MKFPFSTRYAGDRLAQVALPLGGLGAGSVSVNGFGGLQDFSVRQKPWFSIMPGDNPGRQAGFATLRAGRGDGAVTKLVEGPYPSSRVYAFGLKLFGSGEGGQEGWPRFRAAVFHGSFPFARIELRDARVPLETDLLGWSPFVPLDDRASGLPCAILEYTLRNRTAATVPYELAYHLSHLAPGTRRDGVEAARAAVLPGRGVHFYNEDAADSVEAGSATLTVGGGHEPVIKAGWLRSGWSDGFTCLWRELSTGTFAANDGACTPRAPGRAGGSVLVRGDLAPGAEVKVPFVLTWHFPNCDLHAGEPPQTAGCGCGTGAECAPPPPVRWRPFYAGLWRDACEVAAHVHAQYDDLRRRTAAFNHALGGSTLPREALDAVMSNLAILKSSTLLRQENGNLWGWEGVGSGAGCCHGSCTHVYNYAQALPHLFPALERTLREGEYLRSLADNGHANFRTRLPDGPTSHTFPAAADGQLGGLLKLYRDWQIGGDRGWLERLYPLARRSLEYCIATWDPDEVGALVEPHHNTYDIEFWGPNGMSATIYLGALRAAAGMAQALGRPADIERYGALAERSGAYLREKLFNGEYLQQRVRWEDLRNRSFANRLAGTGAVDVGINTTAEVQPEERVVLLREGPKYQYGDGCLSDGVIGAWMAELYGIDLPEIRHEVRATLVSIHRHNFKTNLEEHPFLQRAGFAMPDEQGLLLCTWPRGGRPTLPFVYSDEVWTGIEYQVASHLILEGFVTEGLAIVAGARQRFDGRVRNPYNEYECGAFYARAMASYALLPALSGFRYSAVERTLWFAPRTGEKRFKCFFSTATAWGTISLAADRLVIEVAEGELALDRVLVGRGAAAVELDWHGVVGAGKRVRIAHAP